MRRWIVTLVLLAGCGSGATPHAAPPPNRCVAASGPGPYAVHRASARLSRPGATPGVRRRLDPVAWYPVKRGCRFPLIVFSHGHNGSPAACARLCARLASQGFVVLAPHHADRATPRRLQGPERVEDVLFLLDHRPAVARGAGPLGVLGHSFGGRTAAEVASQDDRVRALVTLAGGADRASTALIRAPTLMVAGGADVVDPPRLSEASVRALPRSTQGELLVVPGAGHGDLLKSPLVLRRVAAHFAAYLRA
jgi:dienelactone hydrolase